MAVQQQFLEQNQGVKQKSPLALRIFYLVAGLLFLAAGIVGFAIPGLPSTPFLALAAWLLLRAYPRLYHRIFSNPFLKKELHAIQTRKGLTLRAKIAVLLFALAGLSLGALLIGRLWVAILFGCLYLFKLLVFTFIVRTVPSEN